MTNRLHTFAAPGSTQRQQRAARNAELRREVGWSLRLNPTKAYAEEGEGTLLTPPQASAARPLDFVLFFAIIATTGRIGCLEITKELPPPAATGKESSRSDDWSYH